jgi:poly-D-alanine transfer protein DltD
LKEEGNEEEQERTVLFELRWHEDQTHGNKQTHIKEGSFKESLKKREKKRKKKKKSTKYQRSPQC